MPAVDTVDSALESGLVGLYVVWCSHGFSFFALSLLWVESIQPLPDVINHVSTLIPFSRRAVATSGSANPVEMSASKIIS
jgi:hypothetical protein